MTSPNMLVKSLLAAEFDVTPTTCTIPMMQPFWVNADSTAVTLAFEDDATVTVQLSFQHHQTLLKFGNDAETVDSMMELCASEWFSDLERGFKKVADYYDLQWEREWEDYPFPYPWISYHLTGRFTAADSDRVLSLLLEMRSVLRQNEPPA
ncbi:hypothetical protein [Geomonas anaerohicana]|uniref:Sensory transduction regulator n=1 Tax=Geomonas anaerohicana TaxID=2798583 RepID=A0ABS0YKC6_9BACT|nr:hypothetical protein [Geomonas anaerohicana]MBJ6752707.1 hypothetical protein [Geomonas anaerohicana]